MSETSIARRYAQALNEMAAQDSATERVDADVALVSDALANSRELVQFFASPIISREKKSDVIRSLFGESGSVCKQTVPWLTDRVATPA